MNTGENFTPLFVSWCR